MTDRPAGRRRFIEDVLEHMPVGIGIFDRDLRVLDFNETMVDFVTRFAEVTREHVVPGATLREMAPATYDYLAPLFRRALNGETIRRDGIRLVSEGVESYWDLVFEPRIVDGEIDGVIDITTEATARVRAARLAEVREHQFREVFEATGDGVIINDPETGIVVEANPAACAMHGYTREEFIGTHPSRFIHPDSLALFGEYLRQVAAGKPFRARATDLHKDGHPIEVEVSGTLGEYMGRPHLVAVVRDISEQIGSERRLQQRVHERTRELQMLLDVSQDISATRNLGELLSRVLRRIRPVVNYSAAVVIVRNERGDYSLLQHAGPGSFTGRHDLEWLCQASVVRRVIDDVHPMLVSDLYGDHPDARSVREELAATGKHLPGFVATLLAVPLIVNDRGNGAIVFLHSQTGYYTARHESLAAAFANQAAAAIESARLVDGLATNSRELSALLDVAHSLSSTLDFGRLVDLILEQLKELVDYTGCSIVRVEGDQMVIVSARQVDGTPRPMATGIRFSLDQRHEIWHRVIRGEPVLIDDVRGHSPEAEQYRALVGEYGDTIFDSVRSWMAVPLTVNERVFGLLTVSRDIPGFFTYHDRRLVEALAGQASIALANARLFSEAEARTRERSTLLEVSRNLTSTLALRPLLGVILEQLQRTVDFTNAAVYAAADGELRTLAAQREGLQVPLTTHSLASSPMNARVIEQKSPIIIDDIHSNDPLAQTFRSPWDDDFARRFDDIHSWLGVPLVARDRVIGMLSLEHQTPGFFSRQHASLVMAFANHAATAIENGRLFDELGRRADQMEAVSRIASALALDEPTRATLDAIAGNVVRGTGAIACSVILMDPSFEFGAYGSDGVDPGFLPAMYRAVRHGASSPTVDAWQAQERRVVRDARNAILANPALELAHPFIRDANWDTAVIVPMVYHGRALGTLNTYYPHDGEPDADEVALVTAIAGQAAVAVENRRLFAESERRIREIEALYQADERLHRSLRLEDVLGAVVDVAVDILQADKSLVVVVEPGAERLRVAAHRGYSATTIADADAALDRLPRVGFGNRRGPLVVEDAANHPDAIRQVTEPEGIISFIDVPITIGGQVFGIFDVAFTHRQHFTVEDERLYTALAQRAGVAIENARLYERSQRAASLEERQRLARELHDSVSQALYGISLGARTARTQLDRDPARAAEPLDYVLSLAEAGLAELRSLIFELRPESLETEGLVAAFGKQIEALRARHALDVTADFDGEPALPLEAKEALYRIGQEALNNTVKHARATTIIVKLVSPPGVVRLSVTDNGQGFDPGGSFPGHMGLQSMKERAQAFGGEVVIRSSAGTGTTVEITLPRRPARPSAVAPTAWLGR